MAEEKRMRKAGAMVLTVMMVLGTFSAAFADGDGGMEPVHFEVRIGGVDSSSADEKSISGESAGGQEPPEPVTSEEIQDNPADQDDKALLPEGWKEAGDELNPALPSVGEQGPTHFPAVTGAAFRVFVSVKDRKGRGVEGAAFQIYSDSLCETAVGNGFASDASGTAELPKETLAAMRAGEFYYLKPTSIVFGKYAFHSVEPIAFVLTEGGEELPGFRAGPILTVVNGEDADPEMDQEFNYVPSLDGSVIYVLNRRDAFPVQDTMYVEGNYEDWTPAPKAGIEGGEKTKNLIEAIFKLGYPADFAGLMQETDADFMQKLSWINRYDAALDRFGTNGGRDFIGEDSWGIYREMVRSGMISGENWEDGSLDLPATAEGFFYVGYYGDLVDRVGRTDARRQFSQPKASSWYQTQYAVWKALGELDFQEGDEFYTLADRIYRQAAAGDGVDETHPDEYDVRLQEANPVSEGGIVFYQTGSGSAVYRTKLLEVTGTEGRVSLMLPAGVYVKYADETDGASSSLDASREFYLYADTRPPQEGSLSVTLPGFLRFDGVRFFEPVPGQERRAWEERRKERFDTMIAPVYSEVGPQTVGGFAYRTADLPAPDETETPVTPTEPGITPSEPSRNPGHSDHSKPKDEPVTVIPEEEVPRVETPKLPADWEMPEENLELIVIPEEEVPRSELPPEKKTDSATGSKEEEHQRLPKTGGLDSFYLYGAGVLLTAAGLLLRETRKRTEQIR